MPEQSDYRQGQGIWHPEHKNGIITHVNWRDKEVYVFWYNSKGTDVIAFDELFGTWNWKLKQWTLT